jgi:hypothetical protein
MGMITLIFVVVIVIGYLLAAAKGEQPIAVSIIERITLGSGNRSDTCHANLQKN